EPAASRSRWAIGHSDSEKFRNSPSTNSGWALNFLALLSRGSEPVSLAGVVEKGAAGGAFFSSHFRAAASLRYSICGIRGGTRPSKAPQARGCGGRCPRAALFPRGKLG